MRDEIGSHVRVIARNGRVFEGVLVAAWQLHAGGWAVSLQCSEGLRHITTLEHIAGIDDGANAADAAETA